MRRFFAGDPAVVAIEAEVEEPIDPHWVFGRFRLIARGQTIGDWDDVATVRGIVGWWAGFVEEPKERWDDRLAGLGPEETFDVVWGSVYGSEGTVAGQQAFWAFHIDHLGMSAFDDYALILVQPPGDEQWLLWRDQRRDPESWVLGQAVLPRGALQAVGAEFLTAVAGTNLRSARSTSTATGRCTPPTRRVGSGPPG